MSEIFIREELDLIKKSGLLNQIGCSVGPKKKTNIYEWNVIMKGPNKTPYEKGLFQLSIKFPKNYPDDPPDVKFVTKIYHPNISFDKGVICVATKSSDWEKNKSIINVIYSIFDLLNKPNLEHGLNKEALLLYKNDIKIFNKKAKELTYLYCLNLLNKYK